MLTIGSMDNFKYKVRTNIVDAKPRVYSKWRRDLMLDFINTYLREFEHIEFSQQEFTDAMAEELLDVIATIEAEHGYTWKFVHFEQHMSQRLAAGIQVEHIVRAIEDKRQSQGGYTPAESR